MADLNSLIAQGVQFRAPPDPFAQYAQMQQLQQGATQNQLAQYQLGAAQRADVQSNALNAAYAGNLDPNTGAINYGGVARSLAGSGAGSQIPAAMKSQFEQQQAQTKLIKDKLELLPGMYQRADTPEAYATLQNMVHSDPVLGPWLDSQGATKEKGIASLQNAVSTGKFNDLRIGSMQSVAQILDSMKPVVTAAGASVFDPRTQTFIGTAPEKTPPPPAMVAEFNFAKTPEGGGFRGTYQDFVTARAAAGRAPVQPVAPTITQVVDPNNPKQMLNVNARLYNGGSVGGTGVIGVAGREPGYVAREEKAATKQTETTKSREQVDTLVAQLGGYYDTLSNEGGITSTGQTSSANIKAGLASSGLGQATGRLLGTQAQSQRNSIVQTRPLLVQAIKNATGMSAKQMDSNVELKIMLATATDPQLDIEANRRALASLAELYGTGSGAGPTAAPAAAKPNALSSAEQAELEQLRKRFGGK
jgi:hypothetical protein